MRFGENFVPIALLLGEYYLGALPKIILEFPILGEATSKVFSYLGSANYPFIDVM